MRQRFRLTIYVRREATPPLAFWDSRSVFTNSAVKRSTRIKGLLPVVFNNEALEKEAARFWKRRKKSVNWRKAKRKKTAKTVRRTNIFRILRHLLQQKWDLIQTRQSVLDELKRSDQEQPQESRSSRCTTNRPSLLINSRVVWFKFLLSHSKLRPALEVLLQIYIKLHSTVVS